MTQQLFPGGKIQRCGEVEFMEQHQQQEDDFVEIQKKRTRSKRKKISASEDSEGS